MKKSSAIQAGDLYGTLSKPEHVLVSLSRKTGHMLSREGQSSRLHVTHVHKGQGLHLAELRLNHTVIHTASEQHSWPTTTNICCQQLNAHTDR